MNSWAWIRMSILGKYHRYIWSLSTMRLEFLLYRCAQYWKMLKTNAFFCFRLWRIWLLLLKPSWIHIHELPFLLHNHTNLLSQYIYFHSFIYSFFHSTHWDVQASVTIFNGNVVNISLIITFLKDSVFIFYIYVFLHIVGSQKKKIRLYFTYLFSCHLWQIFNLLLNDIYDFELACFCVLNMHWGPACIDNMCVCLSKCPWEMK